MFDHLSIGVTDFDKSLAFYDEVLGALGITRMFAMSDRGIAAYNNSSGSSFWIYAKDSELNALGSITVPPRFHLAFKAPNRAAIDQFYKSALAQGGMDEGAPGIRAHYHPNYYAAYVRDLDGYKLEAVSHQPE